VLPAELTQVAWACAGACCTRDRAVVVALGDRRARPAMHPAHAWFGQTRELGEAPALPRCEGGAALTAKRVSDKLKLERGGCNASSQQWRLPEPSYVRTWCGSTAATTRRKRSCSTSSCARGTAWWRSYEDVFGKDNEFPGYETTRRDQRLSTTGSPRMLQTTQYTEAHMRAGSKPEAWRERALDARLRRQQILDRPRTPRG